MKANQKGFLLIEVLIALMLLAIVFTAFAAMLGQCLFIFQKSRDQFQMIASADQLMFELETGERLDLVSYGGREKRENRFLLEIDSEPHGEKFYQLKLRLKIPVGRTEIEGFGLFQEAEPL